MTAEEHIAIADELLAECERTNSTEHMIAYAARAQAHVQAAVAQTNMATMSVLAESLAADQARARRADAAQRVYADQAEQITRAG